MKLFKMIKNFFFCLKYPEWKTYNRWTGKFMGYQWTEYENIPFGWRKAFGKQFIKELHAAVKQARKRLYKENHKKAQIKNVLIWQQIKEKYGELRLYASCTKEIRVVLDKYELLSTGYCISCGKPARYVTSGWIEYYCEDCCLKDYHKWNNSTTKQQDIEYLAKCRLTKEDIPVLKTYHKGMNGKLISKKVNIKKKYGIDFKELWDLK